MKSNKILEKVELIAAVVRSLENTKYIEHTETVVLCYPSVFQKLITEAKEVLGIDVIESPKVYGICVYECEYLKEDHLANITREQYSMLQSTERIYNEIYKQDEQRAEEVKREFYRKVFGYTD